MFFSESIVKVRYAETDAMGVVHHATYIVWFELGRTDLMEQMGHNYADMEKQGFLLPVLEVNAGYKKPFRYGEKAMLRTTLHHYDGLRVTFKYEVFNESNELCVQGTSSHVMVKQQNFRPISIKKYLPDLDKTLNDIKDHA